MTILKILVAVVLIGLIVGIIILYPKLKIASGYAAKYVASHAALSNMSEERIQHALDFFPVKYFKTRINEKKGFAKASLIGLASQKASFYRNVPSAGSVMGEHEFEKGFVHLKPAAAVQLASQWPRGESNPDTIPSSTDVSKIQEITDRYIAKDFGIHAITVTNKTHLLAESYNPGVGPDSRLLGWSMTKTIGNALIGILVKQGKLNVEDPAPIPSWKEDGRSEITIRDLLQMQSGLEWSEDYGNLSDVTRMLYHEHDCYNSSIDNAMEKRKSSEGSASGPVKPGDVFNYASGTSNILSGIMRSCFESNEEYLRFPAKELFEPLGMQSAVMEIDPSGNYILSSYGWATARDWTRFGMLYLFNGNWFGKEIFTEDWYDQSVKPSQASDGTYGYHIWLNAQKADGTRALQGVPRDAFYEEGVFGQRILVIPSKELVISVFSGRMDDKVFETFFNDFYAEVLANT